MNTLSTTNWGGTLFSVLLVFHGVALVVFITIAWWRKRSSVSEPAIPDIIHAQQRTTLPWISLAALSVIALLLRLINLDSDLWFDEIVTLVEFARLPLDRIVTSFPLQNQHMFYSVLAHLSISAFGESAWALRLPSVIFGVASLWSVFLFGSRVLGRREAMLACVLLTVSYHHIWFSQNARGYMGLMFFSTLASWLFLEALVRNSWRFWTGYVFAVALGIWIHLSMIFVVVAHIVLFGALLLWPAQAIGRNARLTPNDPAFWTAILAFMFCTTAALQLYALSLPEFLRLALSEGFTPSEWTSLWWLLFETLRNLSVGYWGIAFVVTGAALCLAGWFSIFRRHWLAALMMLLPALFGGIAMVTLGHNLWPRFFFFSIGFGALVLISGAMLMPQLLQPAAKATLKPATPTRAGLILTSLLILASAATLPKCYALPKQDYSGARAYIIQNTSPGDAVVAVGLAAFVYSEYLAPDWATAATPEELTTILGENRRLWLIYTLPIELKAYRPALWQAIEEKFDPVRIFPGTLGGGELYVCQQRAIGASLRD